MKDIILLGSTGSIGVNALNVVKNNKEDFRIKGLAAGSNLDLLKKQISEFKPEYVYIENKKHLEALKSWDKGIKYYCEDQGLQDMVKDCDADIFLSAIGGTTPLKATIIAIRKGMRICPANKETFVAAGDLINKELKANGNDLIPIDSEQSAIFQALECGNKDDATKLILTASGGPFFNTEIEEFDKITPKQALKHPTWSMGQKITIDSATMMNKALEIIEAKYLFNFPKDKIEVLIHPQSIVHSMVEFKDKSIMAQMGETNMMIPILYSLSYPQRFASDFQGFELLINKNLQFYEVNRNKFPSIDMAYKVLDIEKSSGAVFNAANEVAVQLFLEEKINFTNIFNLVNETLNKSNFYPLNSIDDVDNAIKEAKALTMKLFLGVH